MSANFKTLLLGEASVGKTALSNRFMRNEFTGDTTTTIGLGYMCLKRKNMYIDLWDTAGQEVYNSLITLYYRNTNIALMVFDLSSLETLNKLEYYLKILLQMNYVHDISKIFIIGNKLDLVNEYALNYAKYKVKEKFESFDLYDKMEFHYVSAKNGDNINNLINAIIEECERLKLLMPPKKQENLEIEEEKNSMFKGIFSYC